MHHAENRIQAFRFASEPDPLPALAHRNILRRIFMGLLLTIPAYSQHIADMHAQVWSTPYSPCISLTTSIEAVLTTFDAGLASIITGYPDPAIQAPFLFTYEIPAERLIYPRPRVARQEAEVLYKGSGLIDFLVSRQNNPYKPGDAVRFKPLY